MKNLFLLLSAATLVAACSKDAEEFDNFPQLVDGPTITVETPGTLAELLAQFDEEAITELTVKGNLNGYDITALRENLPNLAVLDMENVDLDAFSHLNFEGKTSLTAVRLPKNLTLIYGFYRCSGLTSVVFPKNFTSIGSSAFWDCGSLTSMVLPKNLISIGKFAFSGCSSLTGDLVIPKGVTEIGEFAFSGCKGLTGDLVIPQGVTKIERCTFQSCRSLTSVTIPQEVTSIGQRAFYGCNSLTGELVIPQGVTRIDKYTFYDCKSLTSITFPQSIKEFHKTAFMNCSNVTAIYCKATVPPIVYTIKGENNPDGDAFNYAATLYVPVGMAETYKSATTWKKFSNIVEMEF
ncbi:MAG: leucine-rich repeat domain-containing protein [Alistipes senegalensis]|nr:leucine-rich repeat domain-containing protein [Bacteroides cellulosilyticus]MCM1352753.1 leucine-rich repeat domain-containing protein [Alistipes senegalensis]